VPEGCLSALAVSDNGNFVATGTMFDGTVEIYIAFNLKVSNFGSRLIHFARGI
jgi:hypothetical protein